MNQEIGETGEAQASFAVKARKSAAATMKLALPTMVARAGILVMLSTDTVMVGHISQTELAHLGISYPVIGFLMMASIGFMQGVMVLTSQAFGAREYKFCGEVWRIGLIIAGVLGLIIASVASVGDQVLLLLGQSPELASGGGAVIAQYGWGMPAMLLYIICGNVLEGLQRPRIGMVIMWSAVVLNLGLNAVFLYQFGWGAEGAAAATSVVRWIAFATIFCYVAFLMHDRLLFGIRLTRNITRDAIQEAWRYAKRILKLGTPMALQMTLEAGAFATMSLTAGRLGEASLAAHTVTLQLMSLILMLAIGMSAATAVRVGFAVGSANKTGVAWAGWTGAVLISFLIIPIAILMMLFPQQAGSIFTSAPDTLALVKVTIAIAGLALIFDSWMAVLLGALRGTGDVWVPLGLVSGAMWIVMVPVGLHFALNLQMGVAGLYWGICAGIFAASIFAAIRFYFVSRREIVRLV